MERIKVSQGIGVYKVGVVADGRGKPITNAYTGSEVFVGAVWAGDDRAPLITFTPTWLVPAQATYDLRISPAQTATLEVGTYALNVKFADGSGEVLRALLEILPSPGTAAPLFSYITYQQMMVFSQGQVERLQDAVSDETGFAEQRNQASQEFDSWVLSRYQPVPGRSRRYVDSAGSGDQVAPERRRHRVRGPPGAQYHLPRRPRPGQPLPRAGQLRASTGDPGVQEGPGGVRHQRRRGGGTPRGSGCMLVSLSRLPNCKRILECILGMHAFKSTITDFPLGDQSPYSPVVGTQDVLDRL
jgi:hypothetical protein